MLLIMRKYGILKIIMLYKIQIKQINRVRSSQVGDI